MYLPKAGSSAIATPKTLRTTTKAKTKEKIRIFTTARELKLQKLTSATWTVHTGQ